MQERDNYGQSNNRDGYGRRRTRRWSDDYRDDEIAGASYGDWDEASSARSLNRASNYTSDNTRNQGDYGGTGRFNTESDRANRRYTGIPPYRGAYGGGYATQQTGGFQSFRPDDYGGADFTAHTYGTPYGGYGTSLSGEPAVGRNYSSSGYDYDRGQSGRDRGFLDRATDEVASWFGDEEAARRREMDHTGKGPTGYVRSDERIREDVCDRLTDDWQVDASEVNVTVQNAEVTLDGTVDTRAAKRRAEDCVERISGVRHVQNNLRVRQPSMSTGVGSTTSASTLGTTSSDGYSSH